MSESSKPDRVVDPVTSYARDVVAGRIPAGELVRLACTRHLADLDTGAARGLRFDTSEAQAAIDFWELCPHLKGPKANKRERLRLEPWQKFIVGSVYGWKREDRTRRFRVSWVEVARKNGKTTLLYPAGLYGLVLDGEAGAEVYSVATKRDQAKIAFDLAKRAVTRSPDLLEFISPGAFRLFCEDTDSKFEALSADADTLDGLNPSTVLCDEIHKWKGRDLWDVIETGMGARDQPLMWTITTAGDESGEDVYGQEHDHTIDVLRGVIQDDARFGFIACLDPADDWRDPRNFAKANPNLGISVRAEEIAEAVRKAERIPAAANAVKRLRLGIRTQDVDAWIPLGLWDAGRDERATWDRLKGFPCFGGLDLASTSDFAALSLCFPITEDWEPAPDVTQPALWAYLFRVWMPRDGKSLAQQKLRDTAQTWVSGGHVIATPGDIIDTDAIEAEIIRAGKDFDLRGLAYDPFNAASVATHLQAEGIDVVQFPQRMTSYAEPTRLFDAELVGKLLRHDGNPCVRWCANNVTLLSNASNHRMPSRKKSQSKIDPICAALMARGRAAAGGAGASYYDTHGVEVV